jgi:predicted extracellular nuclease
MRVNPSALFFASFLAAAATASADSAPQTLPFSQDWSDTGLITVDDNWSGVPGIEGFRGDNLTPGTGTDPQTILTGDDPGVLDVNANQTNPSTFTTGGATEFHIANPAVALAGSGTADAPYLRFYLDTTAQSAIYVRYNLRDLDGSADNAVQAVALHYRVGSAGNFINVPAAFVADATTGPSQATLVTPVCGALPADVENQPLVQLRVMTTNAAGNDEYVAVDDIQVFADAGDPCTASLSVGDVTLSEGDAGTTTFNFTVSLTTAAAVDVTFDAATADGTATTADNDYVALPPTPFTIPAGQTSVTVPVTVNGDTAVEPDETFTLTVTNVVGAPVVDGSGTGTILNDDVPVAAIYTIQGSGNVSPLDGMVVTTTGTVTGVRSNGFYIQDLAGDGDTATSDGLFVFTSSAPPPAAAVGNGVEVTGAVDEFVPSADPLSPPVTELTFPTVVQLSSGNPLPVPAAVTAADTPPTGSIQQLERLEGMRVSVAELLVVTPTMGNVDEETATATSNGVFYGVIEGLARPFREPGIRADDPPPPGTGVTIPPVPRFDGNPERLRVDSDALGAALLDVATGASVTGLVGPLDYSFRTYSVLPDPPAVSPPPVATGGMSPVPAADATNMEFTVASFNLERFFDDQDDLSIGEPVLTPAAFANRLNKASLAIRNFARFPDILGVIEVENLSTLQALATKISADAVAASQPDPQYQPYLEEGNDVGGIDVGFLVKGAPVAGTTPRVTVNAVVQENKDELFTNPDSTTELLNDRPPLRLDAVVNHQNGSSFPITVIVNHLRSLIGIDDNSPGSSGWPTVGHRVRAKRRAQAESLANLVQLRQTTGPAERIAVVGDMNAFEFNDGMVDSIGTIQGTPTPPAEVVLASPDLVNPDLENLLPVPADERYSFAFDGSAQTLDHVLVNQALLSATSAQRSEHARTGVDFPEIARNDPATAVRLSDHDPVVAYFTVDTFPVELAGFCVE